MIIFLNWYYRTLTVGLAGIFLDIFSTISQSFAISIMAKHIFEPLYQDYTYAGRVIGFFIRSGRIILGLIVEFIFLLIIGLIMILWVLLPLIIIGKIIFILFTMWG
ncbi:MAG: hypothetical protein ACOZAR_02430 [Patescibacteria group bacterium]